MFVALGVHAESRVARCDKLDRVVRNDVTKRAFCQASIAGQEAKLPLMVQMEFGNPLKNIDTISKPLTLCAHKILTCIIL